MNKEAVEEYVDDDDVGFDTYVVNEENFVASCRELASQNNFPARAINPDTEDYQQFREKRKMELRAKEKAKIRKDDSAFMLKQMQDKDKDKGSPKKSKAKGDKSSEAEGDGSKVEVDTT